MPYTIDMSKATKKKLVALEKTNRQAAIKIGRKIKDLAINPEPVKSRKMESIKGGYRRVPVLGYRIIYTVTDTRIFIALISERKSDYRDFYRWLRAHK